jgi:hypothetical protein
MKTHPVWRMLTEKSEVVQARASRLQKEIAENCGTSLETIIRRSEAEAGSGALPIEKFRALPLACAAARFLGVSWRNDFAVQLLQFLDIYGMNIFGWMRAPYVTRRLQ